MNINYFTFILVYVDDLILAINAIKEVTNTKQVLDTDFSIKDLSHLKYFLVFEITRSFIGISYANASAHWACCNKHAF